MNFFKVSNIILFESSLNLVKSSIPFVCLVEAKKVPRRRCIVAERGVHADV
jgi:hypothetical protein